MEQKLKISLIIPAYNEEKYIGRCLDSVIENTENRLFEIIVIDNNSTDKTSIEAGKKSGVRVILETNKGVTRARQRGFMESTGDIIAFIDADCEVPKGWIEKIIKEFSENNNLALLSGPYKYIGITKTQSILEKIYWNIIAYPVYLLLGYMSIAGNTVIRRSVLEKMNGINTEIEFYGDDTDTAKRASKFGKVKFDMKFNLFSSPRRMQNQGLFNMTLKYVVNFLTVALIGKAVNKKHPEDFR